jgi:hypothetical protein
MEATRAAGSPGELETANSQRDREKSVRTKGATQRAVPTLAGDLPLADSLQDRFRRGSGTRLTKGTCLVQLRRGVRQIARRSVD